MKKKLIQFTAILIVTMACSTSEQEPAFRSIEDQRLYELKESIAYAELIAANLSFDLGQSFLVEINQFEFYYLKVDSEVHEEDWYMLKYIPGVGWEHFMKLSLQKSSHYFNRSESRLIFDFYTEDVYSVHTFNRGLQTDYQVFSPDFSRARRIPVTQRGELIEMGCESMCHVLDCTGRKFEEKSSIGQLLCSADILICLGTLAVDCLDEGCTNSNVKTCDYH